MSLFLLSPVATKAGSVVAMPPPPGIGLKSDQFYESFEELSEGVFFAKGKLSFFENGNYQHAECNNGWIIFHDFVLVIDANFPAGASSLLQEIRKTTDKPIKYVFNTHHHGDHLYGNGFWAKHGAIPVAHTGVVSELRRFETGFYENSPGRWEAIAGKRTDLSQYPLLPPTVTFNDKLVIEDKSKRVELMHLGVGHTKGDGVAWLPNEKILFAGDSCLNGPFNLFRDADVKSWIDTLDKMQHLKARTLVPGHGPLGDQATVNNQQQFFKMLFNWVKERKSRGMSQEELTAQLPQLRTIINQNPKLRTYLIAEPEVVPGFSLVEQTKKIFESI
jgi:glyoxylase-like metal-dependent hydrolase (beta-lactamase superfamily II)